MISEKLKSLTWKNFFFFLGNMANWVETVAIGGNGFSGITLEKKVVKTRNSTKQLNRRKKNFFLIHDIAPIWIAFILRRNYLGWRHDEGGSSGGQRHQAETEFKADWQTGRQSRLDINMLLCIYSFHIFIFNLVNLLFTQRYHNVFRFVL